MQLVHSLDTLRFKSPLVFAIGSFDGVHRGHLFLLQNARDRAHALGTAFGIVTLDPIPELVLKAGLTNYQITSRTLKIALLGALEPDLLAILPFTTDFAHMSAQEFVDRLEQGLQIAELWMGDDFRFGHGREGGIPYLMERANTAGFGVHVVARDGADAGAAGISSSAVRTAIYSGDIDTANTMLGRHFELSGTVVRGKGRGRELGFPTANLHIAVEQIIPAAGVYAAIARMPGEHYTAAVSIGTNPQFQGTELTVEAYLLDFDRDIYDQVLTLEFISRIRDQDRFDTIEQLVQQMAADVEATRRIVSQIQV